eukprot:2725034-Pyramimonas_sp.AAC.1
MATETSLTWPALSTMPRITRGAGTFAGRNGDAAFADEVVLKPPPAHVLVGPDGLGVPRASIVTGG